MVTWKTLQVRVHHIKQAFAAHGFFYNVSLLAGGTAVAQMLSILVSPLLTRLYTPDDFGLFGVYASLFAVLLSVNSLRYEFAIPLPPDEGDAINLLGLTFVLVIATTLLFEILFRVIGSDLIVWLNVPDLQPFLWLIPLSLLGAGIYEALTYWMIRRKTFSPIARSRVVQSVGGNGVQIVLGWLIESPLGLLVGHIVNQSVGSIGLARYVVLNSNLLHRLSLPTMWKVVQRYGRLSLVSTGSSLLNAAGLNLPRLLLTVLYGTAIGGWFLFGQRIVSLPLQLVGTSVGQVFLGTAAELAKEDPTALKAFYFKTARRLFLIGSLPAATLLFAGAPLFGWVFGAEWTTAGFYVQILAPVFLAQFVVSSLSQIIIVVERQGVQMFWDTLRLILTLIVFFLASLYRIEPVLTIVMYSVSLTLAYLVLFGFHVFALENYLRERLR